MPLSGLKRIGKGTMSKRKSRLRKIPKKQLPKKVATLDLPPGFRYHAVFQGGKVIAQWKEPIT